MPLALALLVLLHALLHLLGFVKAFGIAPVPGLGGRTLVPLSAAGEKGVGLLWLVACVLLVAAAALLALGRERWWMVGAGGIALSQLLVVNAWPDAKAGTVVNALLAVTIVVAAAGSRFDRETRAAVARLYARVPATAPIVTADELGPLPAPVRRWLVGAGIVGRPRVRTARLEQGGSMRTTPDGPWMAVRAEQHFTVDEPAFVWSVDLRMKRLLPVAGRDTYTGGRGRMLVALGALVPVARGEGPKADQGTLLRYLAESVWFPSAALARQISWTPIDDRRARATMSHGGVTASADFHFDEAGRLTLLSADRYKGTEPEARPERWEVSVTAWGRPGGLLVPVRGTIVWKLADGDFEWFRWEITRLEYDRPEPHGPPGGQGRGRADAALPRPSPPARPPAADQEIPTPPSTASSAPVMNDDAGEARKSAACATSSAPPKRLSGTFAAMLSANDVRAASGIPSLS
jgi:hypothetical protein